MIGRNLIPSSSARWRLAIGLILLAISGVPLISPYLDLLGHSEGWLVWREFERLLLLAGNTIVLAVGTLAIALPTGIVGAILLFRSDLPGRGLFSFLIILGVFVPLPLFASGWQTVLGTGGLVTHFLLDSQTIEWRPWVRGLGAAIWIHGMAALPWVVLIVGQGLRWVEPELEEDALSAAGPWLVLWNVTLPRCRAAIWASGLWVVLQTTTEITVTDVTQVRTFAEEVYTQFVEGGPAAMARAVAVGIPFQLVIWFLVIRATWLLNRSQPLLNPWLRPFLLIPLARLRFLGFILSFLLVGFLAGLPFSSLLWKAGLEGTPPTWALRSVWYHVTVVFFIRWPLIVESILLALFAGVLVAILALLLSWLASGSRWFFLVSFTLLSLLLATPGPVTGFGLMETITYLLDLLEPHSGNPGPIAIALWYGPSPVPILWAYLIRFLPCGVILLWPWVRLIPREFQEAARIEGASKTQELLTVLIPLTLSSLFRTSLAVAVLAIGELSASKLVETPGWETFSHAIWVQMHYGVENDLAAACLLLLAAVGVGGSVVVGSSRLLNQWWATKEWMVEQN